MTVKKILANDHIIEITGSGYNSTGSFSENPEGFNLLLKIGVLCNDAKIENRKCIGDPTEGCLIVSAGKAKINIEKLHQEHPRLNEILYAPVDQHIPNQDDQSLCGSKFKKCEYGRGDEGDPKADTGDIAHQKGQQPPKDGKVNAK